MNNIYEKMNSIVKENVRFYGENYLDMDRQCIEINEQNIFFWALNEYGTNIITERQIRDIIAFSTKKTDKNKYLVDWYSAIIENLSKNNRFFCFNGEDLQEIDLYNFMSEIHKYYSKIYSEIILGG